MATRLPSGSYRTQVYIGTDEKGRRRYKSFTADTEKKADLAALTWQAEHPSPASMGDTLQTCMAAYLRAKTAVLSPSTIRGYTSLERTLKANFPRLCRTKIDTITSGDLQNLINSIYRDKSAKTAMNYIGFLRSVFAYKGLTLPFVLCPHGLSQI